MEDLAMTWPPANSSLEPLRPLTPDVFDEDDIADLGISGGRKLSRSEIAGKLLDHLDELNSEEPEPFDWFATEKSIDLPFFDNVPSPQYYQPKIQNNVQKFHNYAFQIANDVKTETQTSPQDYNQYDELSRSLEIPVTLAAAMAPSPQHHVMYSSPVHAQYAMSSPIATVMPGQVSPMVSTIPVPMLSPVSSIPDTKPEWVKAETLTPPDSPKDDDIMKLLEEMEPNEMDQLAIARRMLQEIPAAELEQLVMTRVDDIASTFSEKSCSMDDFSDSGGASSPCHGSESGGDDPEWSPPRRMKSASGYSSTASSTCTTTSKKKSKPYSRPAPEDRKLRKKEQNKNAATRYRMKKKAEVEEVRNEEKKLEDKNKALKEELDDINREVKYLKSLMRDVYRKKGLIK